MQGLPPTRGVPADTSSNQGNVLRGVATEGRAALPAGQTSSAQVVSSEPAQQGQGYRVQVQLTNGEQMSLRLERPLPEGQQVQLQARGEGQVDVRLLPQLSQQGQTAQQLSQLLAQLPTLNARPTSGQNLPLNPGQTLLAQVVTSQTQPSAQGELTSSHRIQLQLPSGQQLAVITDRPLQPGQQLQISRPDGSQQLQLKALNPKALQLLDILRSTAPATNPSNPAASRPEAASLQTLLQAAGAQLRQALPRQAPLNQALQQLSQLARQLPAESATVRPQASQATPQPSSKPTTANLQSPASTLKQHLASLLNLIPQGNKPPSAQQLQTFIPASGLLLEANLVRGVQTNPIQGDLKLLLQQASAQLRGQGNARLQGNPQLQQQLTQQLQAAQSRIQVLQQNSLQATNVSHERGQPAQVIQMDLPYNVRGEWLQAQLEIRRWIEEKDAEAAAEQAERKTRSWEVQLSFDLHHWGRVHTRLKLKGAHLKADVWVETKEAWEPMQKEVSVLEARLRRLGAEVERIDCHLGKPPQPLHSKHPQQIIDTEI